MKLRDLVTPPRLGLCPSLAMGLLAATAWVLLVSPVPLQAQPQQVNYQGELLENGSAFDGTADMKVAIVDLGVTLWSNDGTSTTGNEPTSSFPVTVENGIFTVILGDILAGMVPLLADFLEGASVPMLRVWVDTGGGFEQLTDQPLSSTFFALRTDAAERSLGDFYVTNQLLLSPQGIRFDDGSTLTTAPSPGGADDDWTINGSDVYRTTGNTGIGTVPLYPFHVSGISEFDIAGGRIQINTPGGWPGLIMYAPNGNRRDFVLEDEGLRLVAGSTGSTPPGTNGISIRENGYVGIGTGAPEAMFDVAGVAQADRLSVKNGADFHIDMVGDGFSRGGWLNVFGPSGATDLGVEILGSQTAGTAEDGGVVSLFSADNDLGARLSGEWFGGGYFEMYNGTLSATPTVEFKGNNAGGGSMEVRNNLGGVTARLTGQAYGSGSQMRYYDGSGNLGVEVTGGAREIKLFDDLGSNTVWITGKDAAGDGRVKTGVVEITGGSDLSERFDITAPVHEIEPGTVVSIDPENAGRLVVSDAAYQRRVAGVVSGAGGVKPGMLMGQAGTAADGAHPVALSGRVWTWCDASKEPIEPGDLLTTADTPGHAMKVLDYPRAQGAVIGKAMSGLEEGRGLVLVLVSLQ